MRDIQISFSCRHDLYIRKASEDCKTVEIQGQYGGIIVERPTIRRSVVFGVLMRDNFRPYVDGGIAYSKRSIRLFTERTSGFERNEYCKNHYWEM